jgi:hypothetical protein
MKTTKYDTGKKAIRSQQLLLMPLITKRSVEEVIVIHHVTDNAQKLQLEIERRCPINGLKFERLFL